MKEFFEKVNFEKSQKMTTNAWKNYPACKILYYQTGWDKTLTNKHATKWLFSKLFTNSFKDFSHSDSEFFSIDSSLIIFLKLAIMNRNRQEFLSFFFFFFFFF